MANTPKDRIKVRHESTSANGKRFRFAIIQSADTGASDGSVTVDVWEGDPHADFVPGAEYVVTFTRA